MAEGVETQQQAEALADLQCDELQGYLLSMPLSPEKIARLFEERLGQR